MKSVSDIFGCDSRGTYMNLNWAGRDESPAAVATRISATLSLLTEWTGLQWYQDTEDLQSHKANFELVPVELEPLTRLLESSTNRQFGDYFASSGFYMTMKRTPAGQSMATLSGGAGSGSEQGGDVLLDLADDFPLGVPSQAARLFLDLIRVWQPDLARLSNDAVQNHGGLRRAAYLSWTSSKAYVEPETDAEIRFPFGNGSLRVARIWSVDSIAALGWELRNGGAPVFDQRPPMQNPPRFPEGYPAGLEDLDRDVIWQRQGPDTQTGNRQQDFEG